MKKLLFFCFIGYFIYVTFRDDDKPLSSNVENSVTSQSTSSKKNVSPQPKTSDANVSSKSIRPNEDTPRTNELDKKTGSELIEKGAPSVKSTPSLEDQYNQNNDRVNREIQWCENFSKNLEYYICRHQKITDFSHKFDWHLALHSSQRLILFGGVYPVYHFASGRDVNKNADYLEMAFEPYDRDGGRVILKAHNGRRIIEFNSSNGKLFMDVSLLACRKEAKISNEVKLTLCSKGFPLDHPKSTSPKEVSKALEVSPTIETGGNVEYKETEFK